MKTKFLKKLLFLILIPFSALSQDGKFTFTLSTSATTSAGVFKSDSILVKTLWNAEKLNAGTYTRYWDGTDDLGNAIASPNASYKIKVLSNNVKYEWQGTIGNSSDSMTGSSKHKGYYNCMKGLAFASNGYGYFCTGYSEGLPAISKFDITKPQQKIYVGNTAKTNNANTDFVATDGIKVYWGAGDANAYTNWFVYATNVSDDANVVFTSGLSYTTTYGRAYSTIGLVNSTKSTITGLAVQKMGNYLFIARAKSDTLLVINKTTGLTVQQLVYDSCRALSIDGSENLWMVTGANTVAKYTVNGDGTLTTAILTLSGLASPLATQVSYDGTKIAVCDGITQQVKFYNNATGAAISTLGISGGYYTDATVTNNKFYFNDVNGDRLTFVAFQSDGSYWVNDPGNYRVQHYNSSNTFVNRVMSLGANYNVGVDKNNINRVFAGPLEFSIDYSVQTLTGSTGWTLVKNWGANYSTTSYGKYGFITPVTLSNGRTYTLATRSDYNMEVIELGSNNQLRFTGILTSNYSKKILCNDGSRQGYITSGATSTYTRYPLTGFDGLGNPLWSATGEILAIAQNDNTIGNPVTTPNSQIFSSTNKVVLFNYKSWSNNAGPVYSTGYHLGLMQKGANNTFLFQTEKSTRRNYAGIFPGAGWYDCGNLVNDYGGSNVNIVDRNIITGYHGEFWKNGQTNKYNHYYDNGLAIGQFGTTRFDVGYNTLAAPGMAGNALTPSLVKDVSGDLYLYHGDESDHAGIHRWKITGLNTIEEQVVTMAYPSAYVTPVINYVDLMAGLPFNDTLYNNTAGWTKSPTSNITTNQYTNYWIANTSRQSYQKTNNDVQIRAVVSAPGTYSVSRDLGINNVKTNWKISGDITYPSGTNANSARSQQYLDILDSSGKILVTFYNNGTAIFLNTATIGSISSITDLNVPKSFEVSMSAGVITCKFSNYTSLTTTISDVTGNWRVPKTLRLRFVNTGIGTGPYPQLISIKDFKLYKDYTPAAPLNIAPVSIAGADKVITLPTNSIELNGIGKDADGTVSTYLWNQLSGPTGSVIMSPNDSISVVNNLFQGIYQYQLTVTDNLGAIGKDTVQVTVNAAVNIAPIASAGVDLLITLPTSTASLNGSGTDTDGSISSFFWTKISGPSTFNIVNPNASATDINGLVQGVYQFELKVTDNVGANAKDTVLITVNASTSINKQPIADAGSDIGIVLPTNYAFLIGTGSDLDGSITSYNWKVISGPTGYSIVNPGLSSTKIEGLFQGIYLLEFRVTDNSGAIASDTLTITVSSARLSSYSTNEFTVYPNPVNNFTNLSITSANINTKLSISVIDLNGRTVKYQELVTTNSLTLVKLNMANLSDGNYVISLLFDDGKRMATKVIKYGGK